MKIKAFFGLLVASFFGGFAFEASASTYIYTSNILSGTESGSYLTATVDLNCAGPCADGSSYSLGAGINSLSLTLFSSSNVPLITVSVPDSNSTTAGFTDYMNFAGGTVSSWFLYINQTTATESSVLYTLGYSSTFGTQDNARQFRFSNGDLIEVGSGFNNPGAWTMASPVPEPTTWAMMILGFAGVGFVAYRRRKVSALGA